MSENKSMGNIKLKESRVTKETTKEMIGYPKFREIDGSHPLKKMVPEAVVEYQVRTKHGGQVAFFNFELAILNPFLNISQQHFPIGISRDCIFFPNFF